MNELVTLSTLERTKTAIAEIKTLDELKQVSDQIAALKAYAAARKMNADIRADIDIMDTLAARQMGVLTAAMEKAKPGVKQKSELLPRCGNNSKSAALSDAGIDIRRANEGEALARAFPDEGAFRAMLESKKTTGESVKKNAVIREVLAEQKRAAVIENLENIERKEAAAIEGVYDVIVIDPPWPMQKIEREVAPNQTAFDYPTMSEAELSELKIPAADNCHIWLWTTQKFLPMALRLIDTWGFKRICDFVWHKVGGFQPFGLPQYNHEYAIYCHKGAPVFIDTKDFKTCFNAERGAHSEKPEAFYEMVRRVTAGRRLDMFNRRRIEGFDGWGKEAAEIPGFIVASVT